MLWSDQTLFSLSAILTLGSRTLVFAPGQVQLALVSTENIARQGKQQRTAATATAVASRVVATVLFFLATLALTRLLYEAAFPRLLWLARPLPALLGAALVGVAGGWLWPRFTHRFPLPVTVLLPLLLNLLYLFTPAVDLVQSRFLFAAGLWLTVVLAARHRAAPRTWRWLGLLFLPAALLPVYLLTMPHAVGRADTFEFQVVAPQLGIAHPTGYPLYLLLGRLFTLLPLDTVAWRLNLASAVYALVAAGLVYLLAYRLLRRPVAALLGAVALGLTPIFWSQAIEAEVYTLHALFVAAALYALVALLDARDRADLTPRPLLLLAFLLGLGLTNHLTTLFLLPPAALAVLFAYGPRLRKDGWGAARRLLLPAALAFVLPLLLYAYLPLRWQAVIGEPMGAARFVDWVVGGRFQGALRWNAWLNDPARYAIVGRLLRDTWGWVNLALAAVGLLSLFLRRRRVALVLFTTWLGFTFYALNYYVPDLAVFLIAAHVVTAVFLAAGVAAMQALTAARLPTRPALQTALANLLLLLAFLPTLLAAVAHWPALDRSQDDGLLAWGRGVLAMPLDAGAAILADSEKIAPLYYLQQAEGVRPDLEIMVLPDEASYRAELDGRVAAGQTVYLARFLPGLAGVYHLRAAGPLTEVSRAPLTALPPEATPRPLDFGPVQLLGYTLEPDAAVDDTATAVTLYWQAAQPVAEPLHVYVRWAGETADGAPLVAAGQHPANDDYPTVAWDPGEIVADYHLLPQPVSHEAQRLALQVSLAPPFTAANELAWQTVTDVALPPTDVLTAERPLRAQLGDVLLSGATFPTQIRPQTPLPLTVTGYGDAAQVRFTLQPAAPSRPADGRPPQSVTRPPFATAVTVDTDLPNGRYRLVAETGAETAVCGWLAPVSNGCVLGEVEISGAPLPPGATNFADQIALLALDLPQTQLQPGGQLPLTLTWQSLAPMDENYTVFIQVLNAQDQIVGQIDTWPQQGTYPTGQWQPGEVVIDRHVVQLQGELPPGAYRLHVGWYLLGTLQRLPVLDEAGQPIDDKVVVTGLSVP